GYINRDNIQSFVKHEYWSRAWITQEVLLAQEVIIMAGEVEFPMKKLPNYFGRFN
ncbi:hypothetical protein DE146DRAFT_591704, partial [Phaeosphaeria sp. MPI-PUGE-AT-0046c]